MAQSAPPDRVEEAMDKLLLDIKVLAFHSDSDEELARQLQERVLASHDPDVKRFVTAIEPVRMARAWGQIFIGVGELLLAAFLTVAGFVSIVPAVLGLSSPAQVTQYLQDALSSLSASGVSDPVILAMDFAVAIFLLLAALYTLRQAGGRLRGFGARE